jgi:hypothetical protein
MSTQAYTALRRPGWLTFAGVVMISVGVLRAISAIYYFADSGRVNDLGNGAFSNHLFLWGLWDLGIAVFAVWAGFSLLKGNMFGRVIAYLWAGLVIIQGFLTLGVAPWFSFAAILLAVLVMYAVSVTADYETEDRLG